MRTAKKRKINWANKKVILIFNKYIVNIWLYTFIKDGSKYTIHKNSLIMVLNIQLIWVYIYIASA